MPAFEGRKTPWVRLGILGLVLLGDSSGPIWAADLDLRKVMIVSPDNLNKQEKKAVALLLDEVEKRTLIRWEVTSAWPAESIPVIAAGPASSLAQFAGPYATQFGDRHSPTGAEGYQILVAKSGRSSPAVFVIGNDSRGVLFGVGRLLREMHMTRGRITLADDLNISTAPKFPIRGHQLGYRPKTNSYDGWNLAI